MLEEFVKISLWGNPTVTSNPQSLLSGPNQYIFPGVMKRSNYITGKFWYNFTSAPVGGNLVLP